MSCIAAVETPRSPAVPDPVVRADLAWPLFLPGPLPEGGGDALMPLARWFWETIGQVAGFHRTDGADTVYVTTPPLSPDAREFLLHLASFWAERVHLVPAGQAMPDTFEDFPNEWRSPVRHDTRPVSRARCGIAPPSGGRKGKIGFSRRYMASGARS